MVWSLTDQIIGINALELRRCFRRYDAEIKSGCLCDGERFSFRMRPSATTGKKRLAGGIVTP